ncbi:MAG: ATP-grasp family protein, partial [Candidatus Coatesbacteria bacterium]|nr:ATP-grasp family protein [Candidatus Coatesbacteria bacterium]
MKKIGVIGVEGGWSTEKLINTIQAKTGSSYLLDMDKVYLDSEKKEIYCEEQDLREFDAIIIKKIGLEYSPDNLDRLELLRYLNEKSGVKVFSKPSNIMKLVNRLSCTITMQIGGIPMPSTVITEDEDIALQFVRKYKKAVFKPLYGTKAKHMKVIVDNHDTLQEIIDFKKANRKVMYIQKIINIKEKDFGLVFLGGKYLATYARLKSEGAWNT